MKGLKDFVEFLATEPPPDAVCQEIVFHYPLRPPALFASLRLVNSDAHLPLIGSFGAPEEMVRSAATFHFWDDVPASRAIRSREPVVVSGRDSLQSEHPDSVEKFTAFFSLVAIPLVTKIKSVGVLEIALGGEVTNEGEVLDYLSSWGDALTLYSINLLHDQQRSKASSTDNGIRVDRDVQQPIQVQLEVSHNENRHSKKLTPRQLTILHLMSLNLTNRSIAFKLGFSESTIRQEAMTIYELLNVGNRREAVEQAIARGFIVDPDAN